jgi:hypothetical protein
MEQATGSDAWLSGVLRGLASDGFKVSENVEWGGVEFRAVAHRSRFELSKFGNSETFFVFGEFPTITGEGMRRFSSSAFDYSKASRKLCLPCGLFESVWCFSVALVDTADAAAADSVRRQAPEMHWAAAEIPVIYERGGGRLHFFEKTPMWGAAYYAGFRRQIKTYLRAT